MEMEKTVNSFISPRRRKKEFHVTITDSLKTKVGRFSEEVRIWNNYCVAMKAPVKDSKKAEAFVKNEIPKLVKQWREIFTNLDKERKKLLPQKQSVNGQEVYFPLQKQKGVRGITVKLRKYEKLPPLDKGAEKEWNKLLDELPALKKKIQQDGHNAGVMIPNLLFYDKKKRHQYRRNLNFNKTLTKQGRKLPERPHRVAEKI